ALLDVDGRDFVFVPTLFEQDRDFFAVRRGPIKNFVHGGLPVGAGPQASAIDLASRDPAGMAAITLMRALPLSGEARERPIKIVAGGARTASGPPAHPAP